jgi:hypothetical protein
VFDAQSSVLLASFGPELNVHVDPFCLTRKFDAKRSMAPPTKISRDNQHEALALCAEGATLQHATNVYGMSERTLRRAKQNQRMCGNIEAPKRKLGPKPRLNPTMQQVFNTPALIILIIVDTCQLFVRKAGHNIKGTQPYFQRAICWLVSVTIPDVQNPP